MKTQETGEAPDTLLHVTIAQLYRDFALQLPFILRDEFAKERETSDNPEIAISQLATRRLEELASGNEPLPLDQYAALLLLQGADYLDSYPGFLDAYRKRFDFLQDKDPESEEYKKLKRHIPSFGGIESLRRGTV